MKDIGERQYECEYIVSKELVTGHLKVVEVLSTPSAVLLVERTSAVSVASYLSKNEGTVGVKINMEHLDAVKKGERVIVKTSLTDQISRRLFFEFSIMCGNRLIAKGTHERFVVDIKRFASDLLDKS